MPDCPNTQYCLEIQVILTENGGTTPSLSPHAWQTPVVEDMLQDGKSGLTEAVVTGPDWAILFYGRQSLGEGLSLGKACDTMFTQSGAISWVCKQAQLNTNTLSLWEGWQLIAQAITKWHAEARDLDIPIPIYLHFCYLGFTIRMGSYRKRGTRAPMNTWRSLGILIGCYTMTNGRYHNAAGTVARCDETHGLHWPCHLHLHQIMGWEWHKFSVNFLISVIKVQ